jgi:hypothetical protein
MIGLLGRASPILGSVPGTVLLNSGFEDGVLDPWFQGRVASGGEDWHVTNADAYSGTFSATNTGNKEIRQNFAPISTADIRELSFYAKHVGPGVDMSVIFFILPGPDSNLNTSVKTTTSGAWQKFDVTSVLNTNAILIGFSVYGNSAGPNFTRTYLDDVTIVLVPEPSSFLFCATLIGTSLTFGTRRIRVVRQSRSQFYSASNHVLDRQLTRC